MDKTRFFHFVYSVLIMTQFIWAVLMVSFGCMKSTLKFQVLSNYDKNVFWIIACCINLCIFQRIKINIGKFAINSIEIKFLTRVFHWHVSKTTFLYPRRIAKSTLFIAQLHWCTEKQDAASTLNSSTLFSEIYLLTLHSFLQH